MFLRLKPAWFAVALCLLSPRVQEPAGAAESAVQPTAPDASKLEFRLFWPLRNPTETPPPGARPLLNGVLNLRTDRTAQSNWTLRVRVILSRPSDEAGRAFWNSRLAYAEYDWMRYVRVWDADQKWLWPNLAYLLRVYGVERVERYGGVDPGKGVDNDFAAVLIRKYDVTGQNESDETKSTPLVAAEWYPVGLAASDKQTVVHTAQSDEFTLHLGQPGRPVQGQATVWLIYADFMDTPAPQSWPKTPEFAGGILACFEVRWKVPAQGAPEINIQQIVPKRATGFNWERWTRLTRALPDSKRTAKLSDQLREATE